MSEVYKKYPWRFSKYLSDNITECSLLRLGSACAAAVYYVCVTHRNDSSVYSEHVEFTSWKVRVGRGTTEIRGGLSFPNVLLELLHHTAAISWNFKGGINKYTY